MSGSGVGGGLGRGDGAKRVEARANANRPERAKIHLGGGDTHPTVFLRTSTNNQSGKVWVATQSDRRKSGE